MKKNETLGDRIRQLLKKHKLTQKQLAEMVDLPVNTIGHIIRDETDPGLNKIRIIAHYLDEDLNWIITGMSLEERLMNRQIKDLILDSDDQTTKLVNLTKSMGILVRKLQDLNPENMVIIHNIINLFIQMQYQTQEESKLNKENSNKKL